MAKNSQKHQKTKFEPVYFQNVHIIFRIELHDHQDECDREPHKYTSIIIIMGQCLSLDDMNLERDQPLRHSYLSQ